MKKMTILFFPLLFLQGGLDPGSATTGTWAGNNSNKGFAVLELFTSEGCSSCPPADEAMTHIVREYNENVYVLSFHVDYWNRLGWKDTFSDAAYTRRQQEYGEAFHLQSIYTPQVILNGSKEFLGSDEKKLHEAIDQKLAGAPGEDFDLSVKSVEGGDVSVSYKRRPDNNLNLYLALIQLQAMTDVGKGENAGRHLQHCNIVRDFRTYYKSSGTGVLKIPKGLQAKNCRIIAFLQEANNGRITGAKELIIQ